MYKSFFNFKKIPFGLTPDPAFLYLSASHRETLNHLKFGIQHGEGFILITGDVGTGKTTLCRTLLTQLKEECKTAYIFNPILSVKDLLKNILEEFGIPLDPAKTKGDLITLLNRALLSFYMEGFKAVLIIDEAQDLSMEVLENIRLLSNLETTKDKLLQIVLVGQPELEEMLRRHALRQLNQRITVRYRLTPLSKTETYEYIQHRLIIAGPNITVRFDRSAVRMIHRLSDGVPRLINQLCDRALLVGYVEQRRDITSKMVRKGYKALYPKKGGRFRIFRWAGVAGILCVIAAVFYLRFKSGTGPALTSKKYLITQGNTSRSYKLPPLSHRTLTGGLTSRESH